jgi:hypothetical protein
LAVVNKDLVATTTAVGLAIEKWESAPESKAQFWSIVTSLQAKEMVLIERATVLEQKLVAGLTLFRLVTVFVSHVSGDWSGCGVDVVLCSHLANLGCDLVCMLLVSLCLSVLFHFIAKPAILFTRFCVLFERWGTLVI